MAVDRGPGLSYHPARPLGPRPGAPDTKAAPWRRSRAKPKHLLSGLLVCGERRSHYALKDRKYYICGGHVNHGGHICANNKRARKDRVEHVLTDCVLNDVYRPDEVAFFVREFNAAVKRLATEPDERRQGLEAQLRQARSELENVLEAIRQGLTTPATRMLLLEREQRVGELEAALRALPSRSSPPAAHPAVAETYLREFRETLETDPKRAHALLAKMIDPVVLRRDGSHLVAEVQGNIQALINLDEVQWGDIVGAGSPFLTLPHIVEDDINVA